MLGVQNGTATAQAADVSAVAPALGSRYRRREPERTLLHDRARAHWKTFLAEVEERGEGARACPGSSWGSSSVTSPAATAACPRQAFSPLILAHGLRGCAAPRAATNC